MDTLTADLAQPAVHPESNPLFARELLLEQEAVTAGIATYRSRTQRMVGLESETTSNYGKRMLATAIEPMEGAIQQFIADAHSKPGAKALSVQYLECLDSDVVALIASRVILDGICTVKSYQRIATAIGSGLEDEVRFRAFENQNKPLFKKVNKTFDDGPWSYNKSRRRSTLAHAAKKFNIQHAAWPKVDKVHLGSALINMFCETTAFAEVVDVKNGGKGMIKMLKSTEAWQRWIEKCKARSELLCPTFMPMIVPPKPWTTPTSGGYWGPWFKPKLVKSRFKGYLQELHNREMPAVYQAVNALQDTAWRVNGAMLTLVQELWEAGLEVKGMPSRHDTPLPPKPADNESNAAAKTEWKKRAGDIYRSNMKAGGKRMQVAKIMYLADKFAPEQAMWFPVSMDFRGRVYMAPQYLNPQGCDLAKSLLTFAAGKPLGATGAYWLFVHAANTFGFDKCSLDARRDWTHVNLQRITDCANDPLANRWWMEADKPFQFLAACVELLGYTTDGGEGYVCSLPIMVDGSCNGLQHFSAILRDPVAGAHVNLVPSEQPADIYAAVASEVVRLLKTDAAAGHEFAQVWLDYGITRKMCKRPVMVLPYGGTRMAFKEYLLAHVFEEEHERHVTRPFAKAVTTAADYLTTLLTAAMDRIIIGPRVAMKWLRDVARVVCKEGAPINWTTPTGFWVQQAYPELKALRVKTKVGDEIIKLTLREEVVGKLDSRKQAQGVSPNFVHSMDAAALALTINTSHALGLRSFAAIHDSYGTLAADMQVLLDTLRGEFVQMYEANDVFAQFRDEACAVLADPSKIPALPPTGTLDLNGVLRSDFFFA